MNHMGNQIFLSFSLSSFSGEFLGESSVDPIDSLKRVLDFFSLSFRFFFFFFFIIRKNVDGRYFWLNRSILHSLTSKCCRIILTNVTFANANGNFIFFVRLSLPLRSTISNLRIAIAKD